MVHRVFTIKAKSNICLAAIGSKLCCLRKKENAQGSYKYRKNLLKYIIQLNALRYCPPTHITHIKDWSILLNKHCAVFALLFPSFLTTSSLKASLSIPHHYSSPLWKRWQLVRLFPFSPHSYLDALIIVESKALAFNWERRHLPLVLSKTVPWSSVTTCSCSSCSCQLRNSSVISAFSLLWDKTGLLKDTKVFFFFLKDSCGKTIPACIQSSRTLLSKSTLNKISCSQHTH